MDFERRLRGAVLHGVALAAGAGCSGVAEEGEASPTVFMMPDAHPDWQSVSELQPLPDLACGPITGEGGFTQQCCTSSSCIEADAGKCPPVDEVRYSLPGYPPGSGSCSCGNDEGPFSDPAGIATNGEGECCYTYEWYSCEGRPLRDSEDMVLAPVVQRDDWC